MTSKSIETQKLLPTISHVRDSNKLNSKGNMKFYVAFVGAKQCSYNFSFVGA